MRKKRGDFKPSPIDRITLGVLATVCIFAGVYVVGPWYLDEWASAVGGKSPLFSLFNADLPILIYGAGLVSSGSLLMFVSLVPHTVTHYTQLAIYALLIAFLFRLYALIGVFLTLESWRPPNYLSHIATVVLLGAYWVWVKVETRERPIQ